MDIVSFVRDIRVIYSYDDLQHDSDHPWYPTQQLTDHDIVTLANPDSTSTISTPTSSKHDYLPSAIVDYQSALPELTPHNLTTIKGGTTIETATQPTENQVSPFDRLSAVMAGSSTHNALVETSDNNLNGQEYN